MLSYHTLKNSIANKLQSNGIIKVGFISSYFIRTHEEQPVLAQYLMQPGDLLAHYLMQPGQSPTLDAMCT